MVYSETLSGVRLERAVPRLFAAVAERTGAFSVKDARPTGHAAFDVVLRVKPASSRALVTLLVEARSRATPQEILGVLDRLRGFATSGVPVLCTPSISPRVAELCREHGVGYLDAAGNCHISAPGLFLHVEGRENRHRRPRTAVDPFAARSSRIARVLLADPQRGWQVQQLAREARVSLGLVSRVKSVLVREALVEIRDGRIRVRDPRALLEAWTAAWKLPEQRSLYVMEDAVDLLDRIDAWSRGTGTRYALAAFSGAWRVAPMVRHAVRMVYVETTAEDELRDLERHLGARQVESGSNLSLWLPTDEYTFYGVREEQGLPVVSALQLYLDLSKLRGRGAEAAREVLEREILPRW